MGKITEFVNSFDDGLLKEIALQTSKKENFNKGREDAKKISDIKTIEWPNDPSVKTIGDLLLYVFPAEGSIRKEPEALLYNAPNPEFSSYLQEIRSSDAIKNAYDLLNKNYRFGEIYSKLKTKGGGQFWFDYFIYYTYEFYTKNSFFVRDLKKFVDDGSEIDLVSDVNGSKSLSSFVSDSFTDFGSKVEHYVIFELFDQIIYDDTEFNSYKGVYNYLTYLDKNLNVLLYQAFLEAGDSYVGNYTKDLKSPLNFFDLLDDKVKVPEAIGMSPSNTEAIGMSPSNTEAIGMSPSNTEAIGMSPSNTTSSKIKLIVDIPPEGFVISAKTDMPYFLIYVGNKPDKIINSGSTAKDIFDDSQTADDEYIEGNFGGLEDDATEVPQTEDVANAAVSDAIEQPSSENSYTPTVVNGGVKLPTGNRAYSHTSTQGFNIINSQWYGDILSSALAHIDHPTFDIADTKSGNLGCAAWVSMVIYRAFGVNIKDGKPVVAAPKSVGKFGSIGTAVLNSYFTKNTDFWTKINVDDGQPGDVINTVSGAGHGHIGIVINQKHKNGTWKIASNSSKGFGSKNDPRGCGKINYNIKGWKADVSVRKGVGSTYCWRYKGPKLKPGQNGG